MGHGRAGVWRLLVVNPNTSAATTRMLVTAARRVVAPEVDVVGATAAAGPSMIVDPSALRAAADHTVRAALDAVERVRPDGVIVGAFGDPGVEALRSLTTLPVVGIGEASLVEAAHGARAFAVATTTPRLAPDIARLAHRTAPRELFRGVFLTRGEPTALAVDPEETVRRLDAAVSAAVRAGAAAVVVGGGPLSAAARTLAARGTRATEGRAAVTIVEPVASAVRQWSRAVGSISARTAG